MTNSYSLFTKLFKNITYCAIFLFIYSCTHETKCLSFEQTTRSSENVINSNVYVDTLLNDYSSSINVICNYDSLNEVISNINGSILLDRSSYKISYDLKTQCPTYVSWKINKDRLNKLIDRIDRFEEDLDIPYEDRIFHSDYSRSGYDRGHMCPAADNRHDIGAMTECFLMTNICPQTHKLNAGAWNDLENYCRNLAKKGHEVYVVCGPIFQQNNIKKIGKRKKYKISVPAQYFKVILVHNNGVYKGAGFVMNNNDDDQSIRGSIVSIDYIESITGMDFFYMLTDDIEQEVEKENMMIHY